MNARMFAYTALCQICIHKTYSNLYLRKELDKAEQKDKGCLLYTSPSPRDRSLSRMPSSA